MQIATVLDVTVVIRAPFATARGPPALAALTPQVLLTGNIGYVDGDYVPGSLRLDLNGDNVINGVDEKLRIPRLAKLRVVSASHERRVYGIELSYRL